MLTIHNKRDKPNKHKVNPDTVRPNDQILVMRLLLLHDPL